MGLSPDKSLPEFLNITCILPGVVIEGHRVASGPSHAYPYGSLEKQLPFFLTGGLDLSGFYLGTLNISIAPKQFKLIHPVYTFRQVAWTDLHPPEDFSFAHCAVSPLESLDWHIGYLYYPHPETKIRHFQDPSLVEVITDCIKGIEYGSRMWVALDPGEVGIG